MKELEAKELQPGIKCINKADIEAFIRGYLGENDELKDDFSTAKTISSEPLFSEPEHIFYTVENEKGETTQWQDF